MKETSKILAGFGTFLATIAAVIVWLFFVLYPYTVLVMDAQMDLSVVNFTNTIVTMLFWFILFFPAYILIAFPKFYFNFLKIEMFKMFYHFRDPDFDLEKIIIEEKDEEENLDESE